MSNESWQRYWGIDSIVDEVQPVGGRGLELYENLLQINRKDLHHKRVLDLGTGPQGKLAADLQKAGIEASVIGLSPDFSSLDHRNNILSANPELQAVAGLGQGLPFADETFDYILMLHVVDHLNHTEAYFKIIEEITRVLKANGKAHIGPLRHDYMGECGDYQSLINNSKLEGVFNARNIAISKKSIPSEHFTHMTYSPMGLRWGYMGGSSVTLKRKAL